MGRYLAILSIIALGIGVFTGLKACKPSMIETVSGYVTDHALFDFRLISTLGFTNDDVASMAELEGISAAEGSVFTDFLCDTGEDSVVFMAHSITSSINKTDLIYGRMPEKDNECLADSTFMGKDSLGSTIHVSDYNDSDTLDLFAYDEYTVVGICRSPCYLNTERGTTSLGTGKVSAFVYIPRGGFDTEYHTEIYLSVENPGYVYSDEYKNTIDTLEPSVSELLSVLAENRYDDIISTAQQEVNDARVEYEDGKAEYYQNKYNAEKELDGALEALYLAEDEITAGENELNSTEYTLYMNLREVDSGLEQLDEAQTKLDEQMTQTYAQLDSGKAEIEAALAEVNSALEQLSGMGLPQQEAELNSQKEQLLLNLEIIEQSRAEAQAEFEKAQAELDSSRLELDEAREQINSGLIQVASGRQELEAARQELAEGWSEYSDAQAQAQREFTKAESELADALEKIESAQKDIDSVSPADTFVLDRGTNVGYMCFENDVDIIDGISSVFPIFFFLIAALVCMTTMTRMVDEQRTQIGVLKALGYNSSAIMGKYLFYSGSASILGCAAGVGLGVTLFPTVIWQAYAMIYSFGDITLVFRPLTAILSTALYLFGTVGATWYSCRSELSDVAAELIRPRSPSAGKRILLERIHFLWNHIGFLHKVSIRNIFRYKKRMFMMILGIGGCTALLLTGFGIRDSIKYLADYQYNEISVYDCAVTFSSGMNSTAQENFISRNEDTIESCLFLHESSVEVHSGDMTKNSYLVVSNTDVRGFVDLHSGDTDISWPGLNEAVINYKLAKTLGITTGDSISLRDDDMNAYTLKVSGIFDNYVNNYIFISQDTAVSQTGKAPEIKSAYLTLPDGIDIHEAGASIAGDETVSSIALSEDAKERFAVTMSSMDYIVLLIIFCAGALAFIVLYNLTNINITERIREIATIKVLGFYPLESSSYVFRENMVLTFFGAIAGLFLGKGFHLFVMNRIQVESVYFDVRIDSMSYVYSLLLTLLFVLIVDVFMFFKINRINMAEALKSIE